MFNAVPSEAPHTHVWNIYTPENETFRGEGGGGETKRVRFFSGGGRDSGWKRMGKEVTRDFIFPRVRRLRVITRGMGGGGDWVYACEFASASALTGAVGKESFPLDDDSYCVNGVVFDGVIGMVFLIND